MQFQKKQDTLLIPDEIEKLSHPLQDYVHGVFGLVNLSHKAEEELWNRLTPEEQRQATEIAKRMVTHKSEHE